MKLNLSMQYIITSVLSRGQGQPQGLAQLVEFLSLNHLAHGRPRG